MRSPTRAPFFACMYHALCDITRKHGYALTIHGTLTNDLDLVAIPWVDNPSSPEILIQTLKDHIGACGYADMLRRDGLEENLVQQILARQEKASSEPEIKPHGRLAWNLYLEHGTKIDLSIMPLVK